jgi:hypothetical protein
LPDYDDQKPTSFIWYVDCNNLYGGAMRCCLPYDGFRWLTEDEMSQLDFMRVAEDAETGYILVVDLEYPAELHDSHSDYPLAPEKLTVTKEMLSEYSLTVYDGRRPTEKLIPNLFDKTEHVVH